MGARPAGCPPAASWRRECEDLAQPACVSLWAPSRRSPPSQIWVPQTREEFVQAVERRRATKRESFVVNRGLERSSAISRGIPPAASTRSAPLGIRGRPDGGQLFGLQPHAGRAARTPRHSRSRWCTVPRTWADTSSRRDCLNCGRFRALGPGRTRRSSCTDRPSGTRRSRRASWNGPQGITTNVQAALALHSVRGCGRRWPGADGRWPWDCLPGFPPRREPLTPAFCPDGRRFRWVLALKIRQPGGRGRLADQGIPRTSGSATRTRKS
jgi:hypothetical protein